jgi:hypothetical protein
VEGDVHAPDLQRVRRRTLGVETNRVNGVGRKVVGYEVEEAVTKVSDVATHALLLTLLAITEYRAATP